MRKEAHLQTLLWWRAACLQPPLSPEWERKIFQTTKVLMNKILRNRQFMNKVGVVRKGIILMFEH